MEKQVTVKIGNQKVLFILEVSKSQWNLIHEESKGVVMNGWISGKDWGTTHIDNKIGLFKTEFLELVKQGLK